MGFGDRVDVSQFGKKDVLEFPSPNKYSLKSDFEGGHTRGKSFGISFSSYEKVYVPGNPIVPVSVSKALPGPGTYFALKDPSADMVKVTLKPKGKMFNENLNLDSPKCSQYSPKLNLTQSSRFSRTTFGFGTKMDFTRAPNENPGPGAYSPPTFADKFKKRKPKVWT